MPTTTQRAAAQTLRTCPACRTGHLHEGVRERVFHPHGQVLTVQLRTSVCDHCSAGATSSEQHKENLRRLADRKAQYGDLLMGEEIHALRRRYGLTQQQASLIFGKGKIAFSRYENESSYPDNSTTRLLTMAIEKPDTLRWLADKVGVEIPLWKERCEDSRLSMRAIVSAPSQVATTQSLKFQPTDIAIPDTGNGWHTLQRQRHVVKETVTSTRIDMREAA